MYDLKVLAIRDDYFYCEGFGKYMLYTFKINWPKWTCKVVNSDSTRTVYFDLLFDDAVKKRCPD